MKIGVMGSGGMGGYFGGLLARTGVDIHFVTRGKHRQVILEEGLKVVSGQGSFRVMVHATSEPDEIGPVDLLLFCVKSYDTMDAARMIAPMVVEDTVLMSLQNGIDNIDKLIGFYGQERVVGATAFVEAVKVSPGVVAHRGRVGRIVFGEMTGQRSERVEKILDLFRLAGIDAEVSTNIQEVLWSKFLFICGVHGVSTLSRSSLGLVLALPETRELMTGVMQEVKELARRKGIPLPASVVEDALALADSYDKGFKCSMLQDLQWRRPMEIEAINGMVVKMGRDLGVPTPFNLAVYSCLKLCNQQIRDPLWAEQVKL
ncbi:MAG: 2-dehydropantoate 2-reductase [Syntrophobacteraceae bacterium]|nr:2-dehydropantoate 2-reductase [Syntrophobacteraceae bacterium]